MARRYKVLVNREMQRMTWQVTLIFKDVVLNISHQRKRTEDVKVAGVEGCRVRGLCYSSVVMLDWSLEQVNRQIRKKVRTRVCGAQGSWVWTMLSWARVSTLTALRLSHLIWEAEIKCPLPMIITAIKCSCARETLSSSPLTTTFLFFFSFWYTQDNNAFCASGSCYKALKNECPCQITTSIPLT